MKIAIRNKETYVWLLLAALTFLSWWLVEGMSPSVDIEIEHVSIALLLLAFFKIRLVIMYFMEIGRSPIPLKLTFEIWLVAVCAMIIGMYLA